MPGPTPFGSITLLVSPVEVTKLKLVLGLSGSMDSFVNTVLIAVEAGPDADCSIFCSGWAIGVTSIGTMVRMAKMVHQNLKVISLQEMPKDDVSAYSIVKDIEASKMKGFAKQDLDTVKMITGNDSLTQKELTKLKKHLKVKKHLHIEQREK